MPAEFSDRKNFFIRFVTNGGDIFLNDDDFGNLKSTLDKEQFHFFKLPSEFAVQSTQVYVLVRASLKSEL